MRSFKSRLCLTRASRAVSVAAFPATATAARATIFDCSKLFTPERHRQVPEKGSEQWPV